MFAIDLKNRSWQYFILFLLSVTWGSSFQLMKLGLRAFESWEVALIRISVSFLALLPFVIHHLRTIPKNKWIWLALAGITGNGIPAFMFALGLSKIHGSLGGILNATAPLFTLVVGMVFFAMVFKKSAIWGVIIGLAGTAYLVLLAGNSDEQMNIQYAFYPVIGSLCYGFSSNIIKIKLKELKPIVVTGVALMCIAPVTIFGLFYFDILSKVDDSALHTSSFIYTCILGICGTSLAVLVFNYLIKHTSVLFAASVTYIIPIVAMAIGFVAGEGITIHYFIGMAIIVFGVWLTNRK